jgi:hypothetical protein
VSIEEVEDEYWRMMRERDQRDEWRCEVKPEEIPEDVKKYVPEKYWEFADVFAEERFQSLPEHTEFDHEINLKDTFKPRREKIYNLSEKEYEILDAMLKEHLESGRIRCSDSPQALGFFF